MTSYERVMKRLKGEEVDQIPNLNIIMTFASKEIGVTYKEFVTDYRKLVEGNIKCATKYGIDAVCAISDPMREAYGFGADVILPDDDVPCCKNHLLANKVDFSLLKDFKVYESARTLDRIKAIELFKKELGDEYPIIGWVEGVLAESSDLRGINSLMLDLAMNETYFDELFSIVYKKACEFAKAQIDAGAHIIGVGNAVASLVGPDLYEKYAFKYDKMLSDYIKSEGALVKLHICGNITPILPQIKKIEPDILDLDYPVDFKLAVDTFKDCKTSVCGNMSPVDIFLNGTEKDVQDSLQNLINLSDNKTILAGGCEIPKHTPVKNMIAMKEFLQRGVC